MNLADFKRKAREIHGNKYKYPNSCCEDIGFSTKITILCKSHGEFTQTSYAHLHGYGCLLCGRESSKQKQLETNAERFSSTFIERSRKLHGEKYDYSYTVCTGPDTTVIIGCPEHGLIPIKAKKHLKRSGCPDCGHRLRGERNSVSLREFLSRARNKHGNRFKYENFTGWKFPVDITCSKHGKFSSVAEVHCYTKDGGCDSCVRESTSKKSRRTLEEFISLSKALHKRSYSYDRVKYHRHDVNVTFRCNSCNKTFQQTPTKHLTTIPGSCCPYCYVKPNPVIPTGTSKVSVDWIEQYAYSHRLKNVQHGGNSKEFSIGINRYRVDGFHKRSNTVFEFHGDKIHGNLDIYSPRDTPNWYSPDVTAKELNRRTLSRMNTILSLGFNLVYIWENDFRNGNKAVFVERFTVLTAV